MNEQMQNLNFSDPNSVVVDLDFGVTRGTEVIKNITLRKPKTGQLRGLKLSDMLNSDVNALIQLLPRITHPSLTAAEVADLDPADFTSLATGVISFFATQAVKEQSLPS